MVLLNHLLIIHCSLKNGDILIVLIYVDYIIVASNNSTFSFFFKVRATIELDARSSNLFAHYRPWSAKTSWGLKLLGHLPSYFFIKKKHFGYSY